MKENRAGFRSDCAIVPVGDVDLVSTIDAFAEGTHAPEGAPLELLGCLACGGALSDLAAAGARPLGVLAAYGLPGSVSEEEVEALGEAVADIAEAHGGEVLGGDTKPRDVTSVTVAALGTAPGGSALTRSGACVGDRVIVSGPLGGAGAALDRIRGGNLAPEDAGPLFDAVPRIDAGLALVEHGVSCAMDTSDGLGDAALAISEESGVRVVVESDAVPLHAWARAAGRERGLGWAFSMGGDYELVACMDPALVQGVLEAWEALGLEACVVGRVEEGEGGVVRGEGEDTALSRGFEHVFEG